MAQSAPSSRQFLTRLLPSILLALALLSTISLAIPAPNTDSNAPHITDDAKLSGTETHWHLQSADSTGLEHVAPLLAARAPPAAKVKDANAKKPKPATPPKPAKNANPAGKPPAPAGNGNANGKPKAKDNTKAAAGKPKNTPKKPAAGGAGKGSTPVMPDKADIEMLTKAMKKPKVKGVSKAPGGTGKNDAKAKNKNPKPAANANAAAGGTGKNNNAAAKKKDQKAANAAGGGKKNPAAAAKKKKPARRSIRVKRSSNGNTAIDAAGEPQKKLLRRVFDRTRIPAARAAGLIYTDPNYEPPTIDEFKDAIRTSGAVVRAGGIQNFMENHFTFFIAASFPRGASGYWIFRESAAGTDLYNLGETLGESTIGQNLEPPVGSMDWLIFWIQASEAVAQLAEGVRSIQIIVGNNYDHDNAANLYAISLWNLFELPIIAAMNPAPIVRVRHIDNRGREFTDENFSFDPVTGAEVN